MYYQSWSTSLLYFYLYYIWIVGVGAELTAEIQKNCFLNLEAPIVRVCGADTPVPLALEKYFLPNKTRVYDAIVDTMNY